MGYSNGIISAPVNQYDVQRALGTTEGDIGSLCRKDVIRRLSPYKPIRDNLNSKAHKIARLTDDDYIDRNMGFVFPTFDGTSFTDIIRGIVTNSNAWNTIPSASDQDSRGSIGNGWVYNKPATAQNNVFRLTDFVGYDHNYGDSYQETTFEVLEGTKSIIAGQTYTGKFFVKMSPYHPKNFRSLIGYAVGVAIGRMDMTGTVYYYVGGGTGSGNSAITQAGMGVSECDVIIPQSLFNTLLSRYSGNADISLFAVGFMAPISMFGYQNIDSNASKYYSANALNTLVPLPGLGWDSLTWHPALKLCYLDFNGNGTIIEPGTTATSIQLLSVVNNYITTPATFNLYSSLVKFTYKIYNGTTVVYSFTSRMSFPAGTIVNVSNTVAGEATRFNLIGDFPMAGFNIPREYSIENYRVQVTIWYLDGVNPVTETDHDYCEAGSFWIKIGYPSRDD